MRHEEEMQKEQEERQRIEREEAQMREFKALPILKEWVKEKRDFFYFNVQMGKLQAN